MSPDEDSISLPEPPPPGRAAREAAVEAALRRFDGIADAPKAAAATRPMGWNRHPRIGLAIAASLIVAIGLPAAFIAIRDQGSSPSSVAERAPPPQSRQRVEEVAVAPELTIAPGSVEQRIAAPPGAPPVRLQRNGAESPPAIATVAEIQAAPAPAPEIAHAAPPPPPPPPPAAPMVAQKSASEARELVVTGTRIPQPNKPAAREESDALNSLPAMRGVSAADEMGAYHEPYRFVGNRSFARFMTRLQAAVRKNDRAAVIAVIRFPLRVNANGQSQLYRDARSVRDHYEEIFTPRVTRAILDQRTDLFFGSKGGVMIGNGEVWFEQECPNTACSPPGQIRIKSVNL